jgi:arylsulfatase
MSDPYWSDYPQDWIDKTSPRNLVHCYATQQDDSATKTGQSRARGRREALPPTRNVSNGLVNEEVFIACSG